MFSCFSHRHTTTRQENQRLETRHMDAEKHAFRTILPPMFTRSTCHKQVGMLQSATPATQNDMTTCMGTFEKERFCGFPHRHGEATGKPETRNMTRGSTKTSISCEISSNLRSFVPKGHVLQLSPVDTAKLPENQ